MIDREEATPDARERWSKIVVETDPSKVVELPRKREPWSEIARVFQERADLERALARSARDDLAERHCIRAEVLDESAAWARAQKDSS